MIFENLKKLNCLSLVNKETANVASALNRECGHLFNGTGI
jgi:hypothetical protein